MEPLNDDELTRLLRQWKAPLAPSSLETKVIGSGSREPWWRWLLTGSVRIPVPVGVMAAILIVWIAYQGSRTVKPSTQQEINFTNFQPVKELKPRIIRSAYDAN